MSHSTDYSRPYLSSWANLILPPWLKDLTNALSDLIIDATVFNTRPWERTFTVDNPLHYEMAYQCIRTTVTHLRGQGAPVNVAYSEIEDGADTESARIWLNDEQGNEVGAVSVRLANVAWPMSPALSPKTKLLPLPELFTSPPRKRGRKI